MRKGREAGLDKTALLSLPEQSHFKDTGVKHQSTEPFDWTHNLCHSYL